MRKIIKEILLCLAFAWIFVSPVALAIIYTVGWDDGFSACSTVWTENVDRILLK